MRQGCRPAQGRQVAAGMPPGAGMPVAAGMPLPGRDADGRGRDAAPTGLAFARGNQRFTRVPRADLAGPGECAQHPPARATGPNAESCNACHNQPFDDGAGLSNSNVHRDPGHTGQMASFITRNTPHPFALGPRQVLAEEMTAALQGIRAEASESGCTTGTPQTRTLTAKGINFGSITATPSGNPCVSVVTPRRSRGSRRTSS